MLHFRAVLISYLMVHHTATIFLQRAKAVSPSCPYGILLNILVVETPYDRTQLHTT